MKIENSKDLCKVFCCENEERLQRQLYKSTQCGMAISFWEKGVTLTGYVESDWDYCGPSAEFLYPFEYEDFEDAIEQLQDKACRTWEIIHDDSMSDEEKSDAVAYL